MLKIALGTIFYNNSVEELQRLVNSVPDKAIDTRIWIDGIFKFTKEQNPELPDETDTDTLIDGIIDPSAKNTPSIENIFILKPGSTEFEKRNAYLISCGNVNIDVLIIVDTDEYFVYNEGVSPEQAWQTFKKNLEFEMRRYPGHNCFGIRFLEGDADTYKPRVWVNPGQMRYVYNSHYMYANIHTEAKDVEYFKSQGIQYCQPAMAIVKGLTLKHDNSLRSQEYLKRRKDYQRYLVKFEQLVQSHKHSSEEAHKIASESPDESFEPT